MTRLSEQLEHEAEVARTNLAADLGELRHRMTPGQIVDQAVVYARDTWVSECSRNLLRDIRENPVPLLLIGVGIAWAIVASSRGQRIVVEECPPDATALLTARELQFVATKCSEGKVATAAPARPFPEGSIRPSDFAIGGTNPLVPSGSRPWTLSGAIVAAEKV